MLIYADANTTIVNSYGMTYKGEAVRKETLAFFELFEREVSHSLDLVLCVYW